MGDIKHECPPFGVIDRGTIGAKDGDRYNVLSLDRPNVVLMNITAANELSFGVGDRVIFISWPDGTGKIICEL